MITATREHPVRLLPLAMRMTCRRLGILLTADVLLVNIARQRMQWVKPVITDETPESPIETGVPAPSAAITHKILRVSTSRFGIGEQADSNCTPRGLHRVAQRVGGGWPLGAVFRSREMVGYTWDGSPGAPITHRILWLEGLEPGRNQGGQVDTFARYIYIHGTGEEPTLGRPASRGCVHVAGTDLFPLYDRLPLHTLVWIE